MERARSTKGKAVGGGGEGGRGEGGRGGLLWPSQVMVCMRNNSFFTKRLQGVAWRYMTNRGWKAFKRKKIPLLSEKQ